MCNNKFCINQPFILVKNLSIPIILGSPFIVTIYPFLVDYDGIRIKVMGKELFFTLLDSIHQKEVCIIKEESISKIIENKEKYINFLYKEIKTIRVQENIESINI